VAGVWSRKFEEDPLGCDEEEIDRTTLVVWTQTPESGIYVDLRLPLTSPGRSDTHCPRVKDPSALCATSNSLLKIVHDNDAEDIKASWLDLLTKQKSFAGVLTYYPGDATTTHKGQALAKDALLAECSKPGTAALPLCTCFWRRDIDYQPPSGGLDIGVCASYSAMVCDGGVDIRETGDDGSYAEGWRRMGKTHQGPFMALELVEENGHRNTRKGYWVRAGHRFAYAIGRPESVEAATALNCVPESASIQEKVGQTLNEVISAIDDNDKMEQKLAILSSYVAVVGEIFETEEDKSSWRISDSTNPGLVDCHLVGEDMDEDETCCSVTQGDSKKAKEGDVVEQMVRADGSFVRKWKVVELSSGCSIPFLKCKES